MHDLHASGAVSGHGEQGTRPSADGPIRSVSKSGFAKLIGVSPSRISQMIRQGLPIEANGKIDVSSGRCWVADNIDKGRSEAQRPSAFGQTSIFDRPDDKRSMEAELLRIELEKAKGQLVDRVMVDRAIFSAARAARDAWATWPLRIGSELAATLGVDEAVLVPALKRAVRQHLEELSEEVELAIR